MLIWVNDSNDYITMLLFSISFKDWAVQFDESVQHL